VPWARRCDRQQAVASVALWGRRKLPAGATLEGCPLAASRETIGWGVAARLPPGARQPSAWPLTFSGRSRGGERRKDAALQSG
jgi:hypothetical protein